MWLQLTRRSSTAALALVTGLVPSFAAGEGPWRIATDTLVYGDTDNVVVVTPQVAVHRDLDEDGGEASARVAVDVISAASVDVVSHATTRFSEVREEANLGLSKSVWGLLPSIGYRASIEPDYESHGIRVGLETRLGTPDTVLFAGYGPAFDSVGMSGTPSNVFSESLTTHSADVGIAQVLDPKMLVRVAYTLSLQNGYMEKPYRFVPLFDQAGIDAARADGVSLDLDSFDHYNLNVRPPEEVPDDRVRHAVAARGLRYLAALDGSLRLDYQLYFDTWGVVAHVVEPALATRFWTHWFLNARCRLYRQSAASFWERTYVVSGPDVIPKWRTLDRALTSYVTVTGALRLEWRYEPIEVYAEGSVMSTYFDDYLFLDSRLALVGQGGIRWTP